MAESGLEDLSYRVIKGKNYNTTEVFVFRRLFRHDHYRRHKRRERDNRHRHRRQDDKKIKSKTQKQQRRVFHYGVQVGEGGIVMENSSQVVGNVFSNGRIVGKIQLVKGDIISAGKPVR